MRSSTNGPLHDQRLGLALALSRLKAHMSTGQPQLALPNPAVQVFVAGFTHGLPHRWAVRSQADIGAVMDA